ncbi:hypothetical protein VTK26DRAFT_5423 [Humicola hyalothermophila]
MNYPLRTQHFVKPNAQDSDATPPGFAAWHPHNLERHVTGARLSVILTVRERRRVLTADPLNVGADRGTLTRGLAGIPYR